jgi:hypothetical protein
MSVTGSISRQDLAVVLNEIVTDLATIRAEILALRVDFSKHDHGDTGSYAQGAHTIRATAAGLTGSYTSTGVLTMSDVAIGVPAAP